MFLLFIWMMIVSFQTGSSEDLLTPSKDVVMSLEGDTVTLSCKYSGSDTYFFWYKQKPNSHPDFLIAYHSDKTERMKFIHDNQKKEFHLEISSAAVTDSAVYYCALTSSNRNKLIFGRGIRLTAEPRAEYKPSYFKLGEGKDAACLATGFSRHNATSSEQQPYSGNFSETKAVAISPKLDLYNQVVFPGDGANHCESPDNITSPCVDVLEPDPKVNLMSLTILALRVIFIKTIMFNIIMTLRLWISQ